MIKSWEKRIKLLHQKKYRQEEELFLVEGEKSVVELLQTDFRVVALFATEKFDRKNNHFYTKDFFYEIVKANDLEKTGTLQSNDSALAVVQMPKNQDFTLENELVLALDDINDPGNLGTIIRIADWYGIHKILCSLHTVDWYNPKVITASKGSFLRIKPYYSDLSKIFSKTACQIYGAFLEGENIYKTQFETAGIVLLGNESNGISENMSKFVTQKISIPRFGKAESLNVGVATAIICDNYRRICNKM